MGNLGVGTAARPHRSTVGRYSTAAKDLGETKTGVCVEKVERGAEDEKGARNSATKYVAVLGEIVGIFANTSGSAFKERFGLDRRLLVGKAFGAFFHQRRVVLRVGCIRCIHRLASFSMWHIPRLEMDTDKPGCLSVLRVFGL